MARFKINKTLLNIKYVLSFSVKILSETVLILRIIERDAIENIQGVPGGMDKTSGECSLC